MLSSPVRDVRGGLARTGLAHSGAVVEHEGLDFIISHCEGGFCRELGSVVGGVVVSVVVVGC